MGLRYRVLDLPVKGAGAFCPTTFPNPIASSWGLTSLTGSPGTTPTPVPAPTRVWAPPISAIAETQPSNVSPDIILPDKYIPYARNGICHTLPNRIRNNVPVPATGWIAVVQPGMGFRTGKIGGRKALNWPRAFQRWNTQGVASGSAS